MQPLRDLVPRNVKPRPGEVPAPPDFIGVGTQKSGTTWWFALLRAHPETYETVSRGKELHFFEGMADGTLDDDAIQRYHRLFARAPGTLAGEFTPDYLNFFWVPPLLVRAAPDAKFLVMLRDPIERYRSGVAHALRTEPRADMRRVATMALGMSAYATQLQRLQRVASPDRFLVLQYEQCVADPATFYRQTLQFIGYRDVTFLPDRLRQLGPPPTRNKATLTPQLAARLHEELDDEVEWVAENFPQVDVSLWPNFR